MASHVIIGNGPAGVVAAETLRRADPQAEITLIGDEAEPPYSRMAIPYLLIGKIGEAGTYLRKDADHFERLRIRLVHGRVKALATDARTVCPVSYTHLDVYKRQQRRIFRRSRRSWTDAPV